MPELIFWFLCVFLAIIFVWLVLEFAARLSEQDMQAYHGPAQQYGDAATPAIFTGNGVERLQDEGEAAVKDVSTGGVGQGDDHSHGQDNAR
ncbi:hypothetical protein LTR36_008331 [Oleoguttula mirabilis]|uniref:Uncharacterized protein n=1 Tax=Oleoguttula mirabilis TaxID=1507867 RepID=A0AAV9J8D9_9PEZI|nr:hypothetical protein LTR36_008331 [Oleoguttula mirabilis]